MPPSRNDAALSRSAKRVLLTLALKGEATFEQLRVRVRPMSDAGISGAIYELDVRGLVHLSPKTGAASLTEAGHEEALIHAR